MSILPRLGVVALCGVLTFPSASRAQEIIATPVAGAGAGATAVNPATNTIYIANAYAGTVTVINGQTQAVTATITVGNTPVCVAVNPVTNRIYVANEGDFTNNYSGSTLSVIDGGTNTVIATLTLGTVTGPGAGSGTYCLAVNSVTNTIYAGDINDATLSAIHGTDNTVTAITLSRSSARGIAVDPATNFVYVNCDGLGVEGGMSVVDGATMTETQTFPFYEAGGVIAVNPVTNRVYAPGSSSSLSTVAEVNIFQGATSSTPASLITTVPTGPLSCAIAVDPISNTIYISNNQSGPANSNSMTVINGANNSANTVNGLSAAYGCAVDPSYGLVYVTDSADSTDVLVLNRSLQQVARLPTNGGIVNLAVNPVTHLVYGGIGGTLQTPSNGVVVIGGNDVFSHSEVPVASGQRPSGIAVNPVTNTVYVSNYGPTDNSGYGSVTVLNGATGAVVDTIPLTVYEPNVVTVNPVTNKFYVGSFDGYTLVFDGNTNTQTGTLYAQSYQLIANEKTDQIYANTPHLNVIDGALDTFDTFPALTESGYFMAFDPGLNRLFISTSSNSVEVLDGSTFALLATIAGIPEGPMAVNSVTHKVYVGNGNGDTVAIINGSTFAVINSGLGIGYLQVQAMAVNQNTDKAYAITLLAGATSSQGVLTVIDGASNTVTAQVNVDQEPTSLAVDPIHNRIYVGNYWSGTGDKVTVVDGYSNVATELTTGTRSAPYAVAVNPLTGVAYATNQGTGTISVITAQGYAVPLVGSTNPVPGNAANAPAPAFSFTADSSFAPETPPTTAFYQLDSTEGSWTPVVNSGAGFEASLTAALGAHQLFTFAGDSQLPTSSEVGDAVAGTIHEYDFTISNPAVSFSLKLQPYSYATAGVPQDVLVVARDANYGVAASYTGTVAITTSDGTAVLPPNATLTGGIGTFQLTYENTVDETVTITATDTVTSAITGTVSGVDVEPLTPTPTPSPTTTPTPSPTSAPSPTPTVTPSPSPTPSPTPTGGVSPTPTPTPTPAPTMTPTPTPTPTPAPVAPPPFAPIITSQPTSQVAQVGGSATFTVGANGYPALSYQWLKDGAPIAGANQSSLTIAPAQNASAGGFQVTVSNNLGSATSSLALLSVAPNPVAPVFTVQPATASAALGGAVVFSAAAEASPAPAYQWYSGANGLIDGATGPTLSLSNVSAAQATTYYVAATNSAGTTYSAQAHLLLNGPGLAGSYFGSLSTGGFFALYVREDGTGVFLAFGSGSLTPYLSLNVVVQPDGTFTFTTAASAAPIGQTRLDPHLAGAGAQVSGAISAGGTVTGTIGGASFAAAKSSGGTTSAYAGFYEAGTPNGSGETYVIVSPNGQAVVMIENTTGFDAGSGTVTPAGTLQVTTEGGSSVAGSISAADSLLSATITTAAGATEVSGVRSASAADAAERMINLSTRAEVQGGSQVAIAGFVIGGQQSKTVLIRGVGPTLSAYGVSGALAAPTLTLYSGSNQIAINTGWSTADDADAIAAAASLAGAFALPDGSADAAILTTLAPGAYTAVLSGAAGSTGIGLVEVYDLTDPSSGQELINLSTRAYVGGGDAAAIAGVVVRGTAPKRLLIRAAGPALSAYGVSGVLPTPQLTLLSGSSVVAQNAGWSTEANAAAIAQAAADTGAFAYASGSSDAAILIDLAPGIYTAEVTGVGGSTGITLIEIYEVP